MSATASAAQGRRHAREVPKRLRCAAFRGRPSGPSLPVPLTPALPREEGDTLPAGQADLQRDG